MLRKYQLPEGKRIHIYRSGDSFYKGASMVVNPLHTKHLDNFLSQVTTKVDPDWGAVRSIHTPQRGTVVKSLDTLKRDGLYVAAGPQGFISIPGGYENIGKALPKKKAFHNFKPFHRAGLKNESFTVNVYKNGDSDHAFPFKFTKADFTNWDQTLRRLSENIRMTQGTVKRIYNLNGKIVKGPEDLVNNGTYVVAGSNETFRKTSYGDMPSPQTNATVGSKGGAAKYQRSPPKNNKSEVKKSEGKKSAGKNTGAKKSAGKKSEENKSEDNDSLEDTRVWTPLPSRRIPTSKRLDNLDEDEDEEDEDDEEEEKRRFSKNSSSAGKPAGGAGVAGIRLKKNSDTVKDKRNNAYTKSNEKSAQDTKKKKPPSIVASKIQNKSKPTARKKSATEKSRASNQANTSRQPSRASQINVADSDDHRNYKDNFDRENDKDASRYQSNRRNSTNRVIATPGVKYNPPKRIPANEDLEKVDYLKINSRHNTPYSSPKSSPSQSRAGTPEPYNQYVSRGGTSYSLRNRRADDSEDDDRPSTVGGDSIIGRELDSRMSLYDSGHASLLSDEDRPDSVFRAKAKSRPLTRPREVDYDIDKGGIFRAKSKSDYVRGAKEILESSLTNIEIPVDLMDANEVQEEIYVS